jgi:hypothetical protein
LKKTASAIVQDGQGWYGLTLTVRESKISDLKIYPDRTLDQLKKMFAGQPCGVALDDAAGYLFNLTLPFTGRRKIKLVINSQLEEMLPFPVEDMVVDFQELGANGTVLAAAVARSVVADVNGGRPGRNISVRSLAALHALRWFGLLPHQNLVFLNSIGNSVVIMALEMKRLVRLRHFFKSHGAAATISALQEIAETWGSTGVRYIMVCEADSLPEKEAIERVLGISIEFLRLGDYIVGADLPAHYWAGVGAALMALNSKGEISLSGSRTQRVSGSKGLGIYVSGGLAGLSLLVLGISSLDFYLKQRTYDSLQREPNRIYRTAFPKAPPPKDAARAFEEKIRGLDSQESGTRVKVAPLQILEEISCALEPQVDVKLNEFTADGNEFTMAGTTVSFAALDKTKVALQQIKCANGVELQSVDMAPGAQVRFRFRGKL